MSAAPVARPNLWRQLLTGALTGLAGAGKTVQAGAPGPIQFLQGMAGAQQGRDEATNRDLAAQANERENQRLGLEERRVGAEETRLGLESSEHTMRMAHMQIQGEMLRRNLLLLPTDKQEAYVSAMKEKVSDKLAAEGAEYTEGDEFMSLQDEAMKRNKKEGSFDYIVAPSPATKDKWAIFKVPSKVTKQPTTIDLGEGKSIVAPAGTPLSSVMEAQVRGTIAQLERDTQIAVADRQAAALKSRNEDILNRQNLRFVQKYVDQYRNTDMVLEQAEDVLGKIGKSGKITGPAAMALLSFHIFGTFGGVKGVRLGEDLIMAHMNAKNLPQKLESLYRSVKEGGAISRAQAEEWIGLLRTKRNAAYQEASDESTRLGVDLNMIDPSTSSEEVTLQNKRQWSKSKWLAANPDGDVESAANAAKLSGREVID